MRLEPHQRPIFGVCIMHSLVSLATTALGKEPEVRKCRGEGRGDVTQARCLEIRDKIVEE